MEEKSIYPDAERDQDNETAPIDVRSLPLLHLYHTQEGQGLLFLPDEAVYELEDEAVIVSVPVEQEQERLRHEETHPLREPQQGPQRQSAPNKGRLLLPAFIPLVTVGFLLAFFLLTIFQTVTITIVPKTQTVTTLLTLSPLHSRVFSPLSLTQSKTVPTTRHVHQDARAARGTLTFYNALQQSQYLPSGTLVTSRNGVNIVTTQNVTIPAGNGITNGFAQVAAHAIDPGVQGNIPAYALDGPCCREYLLVKNLTAFVGGRDERDSQSVTQADIHGVVSSLLAPLTQTITAFFEKQVRPSETLVQPLCSQTITADHQVNEAAASVTVSLQKSCVAAAYDPQSYTSQVLQTLEAHAGKGYRLTAYLPLSPVQAAITQRTVVLSATYQARVIYHFSQEQQDAVRRALIGKSKAQALAVLSHLPGVAKVSLNLPGNVTRLPTDTRLIVVNVVEEG